jgi:hypothetical protein
MATHLYLSLVPEALIASMLTPEEFGAYYAVGASKKAHGHAMFLEVDPAFRDPFFNIEEGLKRCVPHENGDPKCSVYISISRVVEHIPISALGSLYLVTHDGRVAELKKEKPPAATADGRHLYQELCPVNPLVVSTKGPTQFYRFMTDPSEALFSLPALYFTEISLGRLATDPAAVDACELPYSNEDHLRQCLLEIRTKHVTTKMVERNPSFAFPYRTIQSGFYFGRGQELAYYPMPSKDDLLGKHYAWWRSAQI